MAMEHQHLAVRDLTSFYLVNLLTGFVHVDQSVTADDEPLGIRFARALQTRGSRQRDGLREVGDRSLFISGFFADSLNRSLVDIDCSSPSSRQLRKVTHVVDISATPASLLAGESPQGELASSAASRREVTHFRDTLPCNFSRDPLGGSPWGLAGV